MVGSRGQRLNRPGANPGLVGPSLAGGIGSFGQGIQNLDLCSGHLDLEPHPTDVIGRPVGGQGEGEEGAARGLAVRQVLHLGCEVRRTDHPQDQPRRRDSLSVCRVCCDSASNLASLSGCSTVGRVQAPGATHVFGSDTTTDDAALRAVWEERKAQELTSQARQSCVDDIPTAQPALALAQKVIERVVNAGFPVELMPATMTTVTLSPGGDAEVELRSAVLGFMDAVRATERAVASSRGELGDGSQIPISDEEWRWCWGSPQ